MQTNARYSGCDRCTEQIISINNGGLALVGNRNDNNVNVNQNNANNHNDNRAWRGSLKVYWLYVDFSQPPSIFPISANFACN